MQLEKNKRTFSILGTIMAIAVPSAVFGSSPDPGKLTVEGCMEMSGQTKEQCSEMMDKMKSGTFPAQKPTGSSSNASGNKSFGAQKEAPVKTDLSNSAKTDSTIGLLVEKISRLKVEKEEQFNKIEERINRIIEFLDSKNVDCDQLKNDFKTFKEKADSVLNAFDSYVEDLKNNYANSNDALIQDDRSHLESRMKELVAFYTDTLKNDLDEVIKKLQ